MAPQAINWAIYNSLPPEEAQYQLAHIHDSKRFSIAIAYIITFPISFMAIIMRFVSRRISQTRYGADDWIMVVALFLHIMASIPAFLAAFSYGGGQHAILMTEKDPVRFAKSAFATEIMYAPVIGAVKIGTLLLFARIFPGQKFRRMLWAVGLFILTYSTIMVITITFQCRPINRAWDPTVKAECIEINKVFIVMGSVNVLTDLLILCLPLPQVWKLQIRRETKLQLIGIFSIGSFVTVVSIYRIPQLRRLSLYSYDPTWIDFEPELWSIVEISAAMLGGSAITYRPLINWIFRIQASSSGPEGNSPRAGLTKSSNGSTRTGMRPNVRTDFEMLPLNVFQPSVPPSIYSTREHGKGDGFCRIDDSIDA